MKDWNLIVTVRAQGWRPAQRALRNLTPTQPSGHYNVLLAKADDPLALLEEVDRRADSEPVLIDTISRIAPARAVFDYEDIENFDRQAVAAATPWLAQLDGRSFHVRVHGRDVRLAGKDSKEEARIGEALLGLLHAAGADAMVAFDDPDFILAIDAVDGRAGVGLWSRRDMRRYRFLRPD